MPSNPERLSLGVLFLAAVLLWPGVSPTLAGGIPSEPLSGEAKQRLLAKSLPLLDDGFGGLQRRRLAGEKAPASLNAVLVMCDFADSLMFGRYEEGSGFPPPMQMEFYYDAHDALYFSHLLGDVADYFDVVSGGQFSLEVTIVPEVVNLAEPMWFYGNHPEEDEQPVLLAAQVVAALEASVDFSQYDTVILVHAGAGEETDTADDSPEQIYSTYLGPDDFREAQADEILEFPYIPALGFPSGEGITHVLVLPETEYQDPYLDFKGFYGSLGVYCFEVGLRLGMISLSDFTPAGQVDSQGIGQLGLMGYGLYAYNGWFPPQPCAFNKLLMGWLDPEIISAYSPSQQWLYPSHLAGQERTALRVEISGEEYWLLEYRQQDPNGDGFLSWEDDLNQNRWPDFWDNSAEGGLPALDAIFDSDDGDIHETMAGAEWDFYMSENFARPAGEVASGSGVFVWHVDEGVIQDCFAASTNLFNADPLRKAVDLEEADGIQDLDSAESSFYMYGGDDDSFRGEGNHDFGPQTRPSTASAGEAWTGIALSGFSNVVADSNAAWGLAYADSIAFTFSGPSSAAGAPDLRVARTFPEGTDLRGSHVLLVDLDQDGETQEIVLTGSQGEIFVLDGELNEFLDHDLDPSTMAPFAVGLRAGLPVTWNPPAAAGDLDADGEPEIILTSDQGIYAFNADGTAVRDLEPGSDGLYVDLSGCSLPAVLVGASFEEVEFGPDVPARLCVVVARDDESFLQIYCGPDGLQCLEFPLGPVMVPAPPVRVWDPTEYQLIVSVVDTLAQDHQLVFCNYFATAGNETDFMDPVAVQRAPGPFPVLTGSSDRGVGGIPGMDWVTLVDAAGNGETVFTFPLSPDKANSSNLLWPEHIVARSAPAPGGAFMADEVFGRVGPNGEWLTGWPRRPQYPVAAAHRLTAAAALPLYPAGDQGILFTASDGRIYKLSGTGEQASGWPLAGPARVAGTPAIGRVSDSGNLDLVAIGSFPRITGVAADGEELESQWLSTVMVWEDVATAMPLWPMYGGNPWRSDWEDKVSLQELAPATESGGLIEGSFFCYPSPLKSGPLFVRGEVAGHGRVRAYIYNLEGEMITSSGWQEVSLLGPFAIEIDLGAVATGLYLCRLVVDTWSAGVEEYVIQFAVVH